MWMVYSPKTVNKMTELSIQITHKQEIESGLTVSAKFQTQYRALLASMPSLFIILLF